MMPFTAVIIDDEPLAREALRGLCATLTTVTLLGEADDGASALALVERCTPNAVFLDIGMPGLDGLTLAARFAELACPPCVVFVTAYDRYATQAFDLSVVDYVLKPVERARLERAIERVEARLAASDRGRPSEADDAFWLSSRGVMMRVPVASVVRVEAERDYVRIITAEHSYLLRDALTAIERRLDPALFLRLHRSAIVRCDHIAGLRHEGRGVWSAVDVDNNASRIGRSYLARVRERLGIVG